MSNVSNGLSSDIALNRTGAAAHAPFAASLPPTYTPAMNGEVRRMPRLSTRTILLLLFPALLALGVVSLRPAQAAAPAATTEVSQVPPAGSAVAAGVTVTYTATVVLSAGQAQSLTIQMSGSANITDRALVCTSTTNGAADTVGWGGAPSCLWNGPVLAGTFTFSRDSSLGGEPVL